jgi:tetratricopeptide (TPR) repeat protein
VTIGIALAAAPGCEMKSKEQNPGALPPAGDLAPNPRITASTHLAHGQLLERQGSFQQAADQYRRVLELTPDSVTARNRLGVTLNKLGRHAEATEQFQIALTREPNSVYLQNNLGFSLYLEQRFEEAHQAFERCLVLSPGFARARMNNGLALAQLGRFDEALAEFTLATTEADAHYNLALIQVEAGRYVEAAGELETALRLNPQFEAARQQLRNVARLAALEAQNRPAIVAEPESGTGDEAASLPDSDAIESSESWVSATAGAAPNDGEAADERFELPEDSEASAEIAPSEQQQSPAHASADSAYSDARSGADVDDQPHRTVVAAEVVHNDATAPQPAGVDASKQRTLTDDERALADAIRQELPYNLGSILDGLIDRLVTGSATWDEIVCEYQEQIRIQAQPR